VSTSTPAPDGTHGDRVVEICRDLIRIPSVNAGDQQGPGERAAAEYVAELLTDLGAAPQIVESAPGRANVLARIEGADRSRPSLLVHGHLDVVPAMAEDWSVPPFAGEIRDDYLWGRGAVDMKDMDAIIIATLERLHRDGRKPARDIVLAFTADEEAGGRFGAHWLAEHHREHFADASHAVGEVGGFSITLGDQRLYLIESAEKGIAWLRLLADGQAGHGSMVAPSNAIVHLAEAVARIGAHRFDSELHAATIGLLCEAADLLGLDFAPSSEDALEQAELIVGQLGAIGRMIAPTLRSTANPTALDGGYKVNVVPGHASALIDGRFLPGDEDRFLATIDELIGPNVRREDVIRDIALETPFEGDLVEAMRSSLLAHDPGARVAPYMLSGGTDAKAFSGLGIACYGFAPLRLPADLDFAALFHGVDERVPLDALRFGVDVFDDFLTRC
jgi:acetylornithine deacetylase/succinyl-diaminopimelate desuccinylase-like protein